MIMTLLLYTLFHILTIRYFNFDKILRLFIFYNGGTNVLTQTKQTKQSKTIATL